MRGMCARGPQDAPDRRQAAHERTSSRRRFSRGRSRRSGYSTSERARSKKDERDEEAHGRDIVNAATADDHQVVASAHSAPPLEERHPKPEIHRMRRRHDPPSIRVAAIGKQKERQCEKDPHEECNCTCVVVHADGWQNRPMR
jgi:hypothetical protein